MDTSTAFDSLTQSQAVFLLAVYAVVVVVTIVMYVAIVRKAGYSGWWILTMFIPLVNIVMIALFAFSEWPVTRELKATRYALQQHEMRQQAQGMGRFSWGG